MTIIDCEQGIARVARGAARHPDRVAVQAHPDRGEARSIGVARAVHGRAAVGVDVWRALRRRAGHRVDAARVVTWSRGRGSTTGS